MRKGELERIAESPLNEFAHTKGFTRTLNVLLFCDRLGTQYRLLEIILNAYNMNFYYKNSNVDEVRINKLLLRKALGICTEKSIQNQTNDLIEMGFLKSYRKEGGVDGEFVFIVEEQPYMNPYVLLSEVEYHLLNQFRLSDKKKADMMLKELKRVSKEHEKVFIGRLRYAEPEDQTKILAEYCDTLGKHLEGKGIPLVGGYPEKSIKSVPPESNPNRQIKGRSFNNKLQEAKQENMGISPKDFLTRIGIQ
ncbi:hypothetical protein ABEO98_23565 [Brevibacillus parabrevis]|uniref:hypothetical protein n=1 Tax=Brevibacillus parabrevis TaxID=54914 RepID=UPI002E1DB949|nr:hypothetical protein [Brevibacillus parabrevis]